MSEFKFNRPDVEPVTNANNANQALYKNCREWREYASMLEDTIKILQEQVVNLNTELIVDYGSPKKFYLENKNTKYLLYRSGNEYYELPLRALVDKNVAEFTESDIKTLHVGSYNQIPVEDYQ